MTKAKKKASPSSPRDKSSADRLNKKLQDSDQEETGTQSVDKIREIIFGNQMQDYDKRFARLEDGLQDKLTKLRDATNKRLDAIESFINKEVEALSERLKNEQSRRDASAKQIAKEFKDALRLISKNVGQLEEKQSKDTREFRQQLLDTSRELSSEIAQKQDEATKALSRAFSELNEDKVTRTTLSELFMELAVRTSNELAEKFNLPTDDLKHE